MKTSSLIASVVVSFAMAVAASAVAVADQPAGEPMPEKESALAGEVRLGAEAWAKSCAKPTADGSCTKSLALKGDAKSRCGPASAMLDVAVARKGAKLKEAQKHLTNAIKLWQASPSAADADAAGQALFLAAEADYEAFLKIRFPTGLDFSEKKMKASEKKFLKWMNDTNAAAAKAKERYMLVVDDATLKTASSAWRFAAMARVGQIQEHYGLLFMTADIPKDLIKLGTDATDAYCDKLGEQSELLDKVAIQAYQACVDQSKAAKVTGAWPDLCTARLGQLAP